MADLSPFSTTSLAYSIFRIFCSYCTWLRGLAIIFIGLATLTDVVANSKRLSFLFIATIVAILTPDCAASPAYRFVFFLLVDLFSLIPKTTWKLPTRLGKRSTNVLAIAVSALLALPLCILLGAEIDDHIAVHHTSPGRGYVVDACPTDILPSRRTQAGDLIFDFTARDSAGRGRDDSAAAATWLLFRVLDDLPQPSLEPKFCDIHLAIHVLGGSSVHGNANTKALLQRMHCSGHFHGEIATPTPAIKVTLDQLALLRDYFADSITAYHTDLLPAFESLHNYAEWIYDAYDRRIAHYPSSLDNYFSIPCSARSSSSWTIVSWWLWTRCMAFEDPTVSPFALSSMLSASSWTIWFLADPSIRQLRHQILPNLLLLLDDQLPSLANLTWTSMVPSWQARHTTDGSSALILPYELIVMSTLQPLPSMPLAVQGMEPDIAMLQSIKAKQISLGITDFQATAFNHVLEGLRHHAATDYSFRGSIGKRSLPEHVTDFLTTVLGKEERSTTFSSPNSFGSMLSNLVTGYSQQGHSLPKGAFSCIKTLFSNPILGYRVTGRWPEDAAYQEKIKNVRHKANVKRLQRGGFTWVVEGSKDEGKSERSWAWW